MSPFSHHYSLNVPLEYFAVGQILKNLKIPTLWQKWQGVSSSFLPKNENFLFRGVKSNFRYIRKSPLFGKNGKGLAHRFCQKMKIFNPLRFLIMIVPTCP